MVNPFHVRVRSKNPVNGRYAKMSLQLYQVDYKSYLLDFKSLSTDENEHVSSSKCLAKRVLTFWSLHTEIDFIIFENVSTDPDVSQSQFSIGGGHPTMEFFEMCASLITQLAR